MSETNRVSIKYVPEATYGVTPTDSTDWQTTRFTSESLSATVNTTESSEIRADRMLSDMPKVSTQVAGGLDIELSPVTFDDFIEAAMSDTWTSDVLNIGVEKKSFSVEKAFEDLSVYQSFTGMRVSEMSLSITYGSIITGSFQFMGNGSAQLATSLVGSGTVAPASTTDVMNATSDVGSVTIDGVSTDICIQTLSIDLNNNLREITCIGKEFAENISYGSASVTGSVELYLNAATWALYGKVLDNSDVALSYTVSDGTNSYQFDLFKVKLSGDSPQSGGKDDDVMITLNYSALLDTTEGTSLRITRV